MAKLKLKIGLIEIYNVKVLALGLLFTSDGVMVGVVIRSADWYDLVKIKLTESEAEHPDSAYDSDNLVFTASQATQS